MNGWSRTFRGFHKFNKMEDYNKLCRLEAKYPEAHALLKPLSRAGLLYLIPNGYIPPRNRLENLEMTYGEAMTRTSVEPIHMHRYLQKTFPILCDAIKQHVVIREPYIHTKNIVADAIVSVATVSLQSALDGVFSSSILWTLHDREMQTHDFLGKKTLAKVPCLLKLNRLVPLDNRPFVLGIERDLAIHVFDSLGKKRDSFICLGTTCAATKERYIAAATKNSTVKVWDIVTTTCTNTFTSAKRREYTNIIYNGDHQIIAGCLDGMYAFDTRSKCEVMEIHGLPGIKTSITSSESFISAGNDGSLPGPSAATWDIRWHNLPVFRYSLPGYPMIRPDVDVMFLRQHCLTFTAGSDIYSYSLKDGNLLSITSTPYEKMAHYRVSPDGKILVFLGVGVSRRIQFKDEMKSVLDARLLRTIGVDCHTAQESFKRICRFNQI